MHFVRWVIFKPPDAHNIVMDTRELSALHFFKKSFLFK